MADITNDCAKRVWIYCRTAHDDGITLSLQESVLKEFAERQGWAVAGVTAETGSGLEYNRKGLKEVVQAVKSKQTDIVLAKDISRIGRTGLDTTNYIYELFNLGVEFTTLNDHASEIKPWQVAVYIPPWVRDKN